jgi:hypothetical protein
VTALAGVPAADACFPGHLGEAPVELVDVQGAPFSWQKTRSLPCQAPPAARRSLACLAR